MAVETIPVRLFESLTQQVWQQQENHIKAINEMVDALKSHDAQSIEKKLRLEASLSELKNIVDEIGRIAHQDHLRIEQALVEIKEATDELSGARREIEELKKRITWGAGLLIGASQIVWWVHDFFNKLK